MAYLIRLLIPLLLCFSCKKDEQKPDVNVPDNPLAHILGKYSGDDSEAEITKVSDMQADLWIYYMGLTHVDYNSMPLSIHGDTIYIIEPNPEVNTIYVIKDTLMVLTYKQLKLIKN